MRELDARRRARDADAVRRSLERGSATTASESISPSEPGSAERPTLSVTVVEELGPGDVVVELANEPGTMWRVRSVRSDPPLQVWTRMETDGPT